MTTLHTENVTNATPDNQSSPDAELKAALERFETCLLSPIISGELADWVAEADKAWGNAVAQIRVHAAELHPRQFKQISKVDPELLPRTEKLQAEDAEIIEDVDEFDRALRRFVEHAPKFEPDEEKISSHAEKVVNGGVALITRVRKQEAALQTWFIESFNRDRGVAD
jgi:hypothetical protein